MLHFIGHIRSVIRGKIQHHRRKHITGYNIRGQNNKIIIIENGTERLLRTGEKIPGLNVEIVGNNNTVRLELPMLNVRNCGIQIANDNTEFSLGRTNWLQNTWFRLMLGDGQKCTIGKYLTCESGLIMLNSTASVSIGDDCMFSSDIFILASDGYTIIDNDTGEVLNNPVETLYIGNHVWVGQGAKITKKAKIYDNSIVAAGTIACKDYKQSNIIIAGNPGKIIKTNINWDRKYN